MQTISRKSILLFLVTSLFLCRAGHAEEYSTEGIKGASGLANIETIFFEFDTKLSMDVLFGEPVINAKLKWRIDPAQSLAEIPSSGEDRYETVPLYDLGSEAYNKVKLYNVKLQFQFAANSGETVYLLQDVGVPDAGDGEKWSFNVPGSPSWEELFYRSPVRSSKDSRSYFSPQASKKFFVQKLKLLDVTIVSGEVSFYDLQNWYAKETAEPRVAALKSAMRRIASGIEESFGLKVDVEKEIAWKPIYQDPLGEGKRVKFFKEYEEHLLKKVEKFSSLPKSLQENGDPDNYFDALNEANEIVQNSLQFNFSSSEVDVAGLEPINKKKRPGVFARKEIDGEFWLVNTATDEAIRVLDYDQYLVGSRYLVDRGVAFDQKCSNGKIQLPLLDPITLEQQSSLQLSCSQSGQKYFNIGYAEKDGVPVYLSVSVRLAPERKVLKSWTCKHCGTNNNHSSKLREVELRDFKIEENLSVELLGDRTWKEAGSCAFLVLCRN